MLSQASAARETPRQRQSGRSAAEPIS